VNPFQYTGRDNDSETGLYYYRARYFDPRVGRFISEDPLGVRDHLNPKTDPILAVRKATNPGNVYAGTDLSDGSHRLSWGYLDDECDGIVDIEIAVSGRRLTAYARIAAGSIN
jgi:uncharacterized protein RhaS with RHS repeats